MDRRQFLKSLGIGAAALGTTVQSETLVRAFASAAQVGAFAPLRDGAARDVVTHVITRLTYGMTPTLYTAVRESGAQAFIEQQLTPERLDNRLVEALLDPLRPILDENGGVLQRNFEARRSDVALALVGGTMARQVFSQTQLHERMVHFWGDHFSVFIEKGPVLFLKVDDDRDVIRPKALGLFRELLGASAHSPAMLVYLDNARSERSAPNENYARELMELHTLGVRGGYTEDDVKEVARAFTGWTISGRRENGDGRTLYQFRELFHDNGEKVVLGTVIPAGGGESDGERVLDLLATHPSTAQRIAFKLARRFIEDYPTSDVVDTIAAAFTDSGGDIKATLRAIFALPAFWNAPPKYKQPQEYVVSVIRALNSSLEDTTALSREMRRALAGLGNLPFTWPAPDGFPDVQTAWQDGLLIRWNVAVAAATDQLNGVSSGTESLVELMEANGVELETEPVLTFLASYLLGREMTADEWDIILTFADETGGDTGAQVAAGLALMLASPAFQYR